MAYKAKLSDGDVKYFLEANHFWNITKGVGWGYDNKWDDVLLIQYLLNCTGKTEQLVEDGIFGKKTQKAIKAFQKLCHGMLNTDGKVNAVDGSEWDINNSNFTYTIYLLNSHYLHDKRLYYEDLRKDPKLPSELCQILSWSKNE